MLFMRDIDWATISVLLLQITFRNAIGPAQKISPTTAMDPQTWIGGG